MMRVLGLLFLGLSNLLFADEMPTRKMSFFEPKHLKGMHEFFDCPDDEIIYYDYIIIGAGTSGALLANKLSGAGYKVLALEAGEFRNSDAVVLNPNWISVANELAFSPRYSVSFLMPINLLEAVPITEGRMVGGSSGHNFLFAARGTPRIYDQWAAISGDADWSYSNLLPLMKSVESYTPNGTIANPVQRGSNGAISVTQRPPINTDPTLASLSTVTGSPFVNDYNDPSNGEIGIGALQETVTPPPNSRRSFSGNEYLGIGTVVDANGFGLNGRKLRVITTARALRFDLDSQLGATAVSYVYTSEKGKVYKAHLAPSTGKLIVAAGANKSPGIFIHSGVGPANELAAVGIPVKLNSPQMGKNVQSHYGVSALMTGNLSGAAENFIDLRPYMPCPSPSLADGVRRFQMEVLNAGPNVTLAFGWNIGPSSKGSFTVVDNDPLVELNFSYPIYADGPENQCGTDAYMIVSYLRTLKAFADAAGQVLIRPNANDLASDANLLAYAKSLANISIPYHNAGTTRMGTNISNSVVNGNLKVHGLKNVYTADVGVQPVIMNANTALSAYYIAMNLLKSLNVPVTADN